jgi:hypothetical protein
MPMFQHMAEACAARRIAVERDVDVTVQKWTEKPSVVGSRGSVLQSDAGLSQAITRTLEALTPILGDSRRRRAVSGGIAVIARGVPRVTRDIDIASSGADVTLQGLAAELGRAGRCSDLPPTR